MYIHLFWNVHASVEILKVYQKLWKVTLLEYYVTISGTMMCQDELSARMVMFYSPFSGPSFPAPLLPVHCCSTGPPLYCT